MKNKNHHIWISFSTQNSLFCALKFSITYSSPADLILFVKGNRITQSQLFNIPSVKYSHIRLIVYCLFLSITGKNVQVYLPHLAPQHFPRLILYFLHYFATLHLYNDGLSGYIDLTYSQVLSSENSHFLTDKFMIQSAFSSDWFLHSRKITVPRNFYDKHLSFVSRPFIIEDPSVTSNVCNIFIESLGIDLKLMLEKYINLATKVNNTPFYYVKHSKRISNSSLPYNLPSNFVIFNNHEISCLELDLMYIADNYSCINVFSGSTSSILFLLDYVLFNHLNTRITVHICEYFHCLNDSKIHQTKQFYALLNSYSSLSSGFRIVDYANQ